MLPFDLFTAVSVSLPLFWVMVVSERGKKLDVFVFFLFLLCVVVECTQAQTAFYDGRVFKTGSWHKLDVQPAATTES